MDQFIPATNSTEEDLSQESEESKINNITEELEGTSFKSDISETNTLNETTTNKIEILSENENHLTSKDASSSDETPPSDEEMIYRQRQLSMLLSEDAESEYVTSEEWRNEPRHIFVLTEAGKPVYSRHGSEDKLSSVMGVMLAIVSCVHDRNDKIKNIIAGKHKFVFLVKIPLILVAVCSTPESTYQINKQLEYVYNTIVSVLTLSQLERIYAKQKNFDLRRLLTGTDKFLDHLCDSIQSNPQYLLNSVQCLSFPGGLRDLVSQSLQQSKTEDLAFAILISSGRIVSTCRLKEHNLVVSDLHILMNLVNASTAFHDGETWLPICLPHFNPQGFLHAHISYLDEEFQTCLMLISADRDSFFTLSECKKKVVAKLTKHGCLSAIKIANSNTTYCVSKIGISNLRHFIYKSDSLEQFTMPEFSTPYNMEKDRQRLFGHYQQLHGRIHNPSAPLKLLYTVSDEETLLAWVASGFELYAAFSPLVTKKEAIAAIDRLLRWIKNKEDELFLTRPLTF